ncbi:uncharacterized protein LOC135054822 [Pseudophryne corroboree]|uniref:uncharacterized protein LOC135054822 n=1 Tax=Pseudophryne corroboree TaxID=495146 RepID=UPI003081302D
MTDIKVEVIEGEDEMYMSDQPCNVEESPTDISTDGPRNRDTPERCPRPLYSQDGTEENHRTPQEDQSESMTVIKVESVDGEEETYVRGDQQCKEEEIPTDISPGMVSNVDRTFTTRFIDIYRASDCLWQVSSRDYSNKQKRDQAYKQLVQYSRAKKNGVDLAWVKKKIANLRTVFVKEHGRVIESKRSGAGIDEVYKPTLWYYDQMKFLLERKSQRMRQEVDEIIDLESNPELDVDTSTTTEAAELECTGEQSAATSLRSPPSKQRRKTSSSAATSSEHFFKHAEKMLNRPLDNTRQFANMIESQMREMPESIRRTFKRIIFDALGRAEDNDLSDDLDLMPNPMRHARHAPQPQYPYHQPFTYPPETTPPQHPVFPLGPTLTPTLPTRPTSTLSGGVCSAMQSTQAPAQDNADF